MDQVIDWTPKETKVWLQNEGFSASITKLLCDEHEVDGKCLLSLNEQDFMVEPLVTLRLREKKSFYLACKSLQKNNQNSMLDLGLCELAGSSLCSPYPYYSKPESVDVLESDRHSLLMAENERTHHKFPPDKMKACVAFGYVIVVTWITAFVMVIVHDRVPDMKKYPPLPDIFLDNVPHIPWAFEMCELTGTFLMIMWLIVLLFHKHRFILMRRFFALSGTVFLLRCVTMLITSLSVPGAHLQCQPRVHSFEGTSVFHDLTTKMTQAYTIWRGAGMSIQGVRTCGDYMFSGHTVALTMLNFFITEYTPRYVYYLHTLSWMMNMFGIFFILAAHEHYSIDVFVAFYITSRLFLYYHTLSNNQALMQRDSTRTKVWFPLYSYFESSVEGIVPNVYETPGEIIANLLLFCAGFVADVRHLVAVTHMNRVRDDENCRGPSNHVINHVDSSTYKASNIETKLK